MPANKFSGHPAINGLTVLSLVFTLFAAFLDDATFKDTTQLPIYLMMVWLFVALASSVLLYKNFVCGFLLSAFCMMVAWRIAGIYAVYNVVFPLTITFALFLFNFIYCAYSNLSDAKNSLSVNTWQLVFIRMYIGFDFIPHFTEKLFAGPGPRMADINAFIQLGVPHADFFVYLAGFCELGAAIGLCLGFMMRFSGVGAALYLIIATYLGHHFLNGFIWAGPGGGWEFAIMWIILILSYSITGAHEFSVDQVIETKFNLPGWVKRLM